MPNQAELLERLDALERENVRLKAALSTAGTGCDDLLTVTALNEDLRTAFTALEQSRAAHADSERRLRAILDSAVGHAILTLAPDGRITSWNPGAVRIFGWTEEEARGRPVAILFPADDSLAGLPDALRLRALAEGRIQEERAFRRHDGSGVWGALTILPLQADEEGFLWILHDRSDERRIEDAIADARRCATDILDSIDEALVALDGDYRVIYQNRRAEQLDRQSLSAMRGRRLWEGLARFARVGPEGAVSQDDDGAAADRHRKALRWRRHHPVAGNALPADAGGGGLLLPRHHHAQAGGGGGPRLARAGGQDSGKHQRRLLCGRSRLALHLHQPKG
ncbi:PAS domain S-box protein [Azospirillum sp. B506]|uniref:PAS domain-containing protein n=1 Tax=Azospirillum sp. B506 TaxID=137721 RepID=UPI001FCC9D34|nr:PAS domain S-box protein [Azospirillum sp. B506]